MKRNDNFKGQINGKYYDDVQEFMDDLKNLKNVSQYSFSYNVEATDVGNNNNDTDRGECLDCKCTGKPIVDTRKELLATDFDLPELRRPVGWFDDEDNAYQFMESLDEKIDKLEDTEKYRMSAEEIEKLRLMYKDIRDRVEKADKKYNDIVDMYQNRANICSTILDYLDRVDNMFDDDNDTDIL